MSDGLFIYDGPPSYAAGVRASIAEAPAPVDERVTADATAPDVVTFANVADMTFVQGVASSVDVSGFATDAQGLPLRFTQQAGTPPTGVALNEATKRVEYDGIGAIGSSSGNVLRATAGVNYAVAETVSAVVEAIAADATAAFVGSQASINEVLAPVIEAVTADATGTPILGTRYPNREAYGTLSQAEKFFGDVDTVLARALGNDQYLYPNGTRTNNGWYCGGMDQVNTGPNHGNPVTRRWRTAGGDWFGKTHTYRDTTTATCFALSPIVLHSAGEQLVSITGADLTALVNEWVQGAMPNYGVRLDLDNGNTCYLHSRHASGTTNTDSTKWPTLVVTTTGNGTVTLPCARSAWLVANDGAARAKPVFLELQSTGVSAWTGLLAFDTSALSGTVTAATLNVWAYQFAGSAGSPAGSEHIRVWRLWNPNDYSSAPTIDGYPGWVLPPIELGISAQQGDKDANILAHPQVLFFEDYAVTDPANARYYQNNLDNGSQTWDGATLVTAADANGFTKLFGTQNALKIGPRLNVTTGAPGPAVIDPRWRAGSWAVKSYQPKGPQNALEDIYFRYYVLLGNNYGAWPNGTKLPGPTGLYNGFTGMGRGNGGAGGDGLSGWTFRGSAGSRQGTFPAAGEMTSTYAFLAGYDTSGTPLDRFVGYGGWNDAYTPDMLNANGPYEGFGGSYLNQFERAKWQCFEQRLKCNSVTDPNARSKQIASATSDGIVGKYNLVAPDPSLFVGQVVSLGGMSNAYQGWWGSPGTSVSWRTIVAVGAMAALDSSTWWFQCGDAAHPVNTTAAMTLATGGVAMYCTSLGNYDGILAMWVNGRKTYERTDLRVRHCAWCFDGVTPFGIDGIWFSVYLGGRPYDVQTTYNPYWPNEQYHSNVVISTGYIGPAIGYGGA